MGQGTVEHRANKRSQSDDHRPETKRSTQHFNRDCVAHNGEGTGDEDPCAHTFNDPGRYQPTMTRGSRRGRSTQRDNNESRHEHRAPTDMITDPTSSDDDDSLRNRLREHDPEKFVNLHIVLTPDTRERNGNVVNGPSCAEHHGNGGPDDRAAP